MSAIYAYRAINDDLTRLECQATTLDEATILTGHGTYSVFRLYPGRRVLRLDQHLARMRRSAAMLGVPFPHDNAWLRRAIRRAVEASGLEMPRVRITVPYDAPESAVILLEPFSPPPPEVYKTGVRVALADTPRTMPGAKDSRFIEQRAQLRAADPDAYEVLLCDASGRILEGTGSNFYAVLDGKLRTAGEGMLEGIARHLLLEAAPAILPVVLEPVTRDDLPQVTEAMMTSSSRGVVPITRIGDQPIGDGVPGPFTHRLGAAYDAHVETELESL